MRINLLCPKCKCRKIWLIEEVRHFNTYSGGAPLNVVYDRRVGKTGTGFFSGGERAKQSVGHYDVFVCASCGFAEWYARGLEGLEENPADGVRLLDGETQTDAYR